MRDNNIKLHAGLDESRTGKFNYLRIVEQTGRVALQFPDKNTEFAEFNRGDVLEFDGEQSHFIARSLEPDGSDPVEFWVQTMAGIRARSALLVGEVTITGVEQDTNDEPLIVRAGRGLDIAAIVSFVVIGKLLAAPIPGTSGIRYTGAVNVPDSDKYAYLHITNNSMVPQGAGQQIIDRRIAIVPNSASLLPIRWIEEGETVVVPAMSVVAFASIISDADWANDAKGFVTIVGELK